MHVAALVFHPAFLRMIAIFVAVVWMLRDEADKMRPLVVLAIIINIFYGFVLSIVLGREDSLVPWKYDLILQAVDHALGFSAAAIAIPLIRGFWRVPLQIVYESLLPLVVLCFLQRRAERRNIVVRGIVAELILGPLFYAVLPACGPIYAFRANWLHPMLEPAHTIRLSGFPNAFPSVHVATAFLFLCFARRVWWRGAALVFLLGTMLSTLSTGEHFVVDLIAGLAFGCFAGAVAYQKWRAAVAYLFVVGLWSVGVRFGYEVLLSHPHVLRFFAMATVLIAVHGVLVAWDIVPAMTHSALKVAGVERARETAGLSAE